MLPSCAVVLLTAFGWYATRTVRPYDCHVTVAAFADSDGQPFPDSNGRPQTWHELDERAYQEAVDAGRCDPPTARWRQWLT